MLTDETTITHMLSSFLYLLNEKMQVRGLRTMPKA